jgi:hypothetical protein
MVQTMYEVRVAGAVPEKDLQDMGAVTLPPEQVNTVLYGISDQAALYGLLARLRALGLEVVEVRRVPTITETETETEAGTPEEPGGKEAVDD